VDCRNPQYIGFKGQRLNYFNVAQVGKNQKDTYSEDQAIAIFNLNPISMNLQQQIQDIAAIMKNKEIYVLTCFDEVTTKENYQVIAERYDVSKLNVI